MSAVPASTALQ